MSYQQGQFPVISKANLAKNIFDLPFCAPKLQRIQNPDSLCISGFLGTFCGDRFRLPGLMP